MRPLFLIHTVASVVSLFKELCSELLPGVPVRNLVDESILPDLREIGLISPSITRRVCELIVRAEQSGAEAIMVTCSSIGPCVETARRLVDVPLLRVDEPMADRAVRLSDRVGVVATLPTTLDPTIALLKARAAARGKCVSVLSELCVGAFEAAQAGRSDEHDELVMEGIRRLARRAPVLVLAQASMARVLQRLGPIRGCTVLTSPRSGILQLRRLLAKLRRRNREVESP